jgi:hypothetical protein
VAVQQQHDGQAEMTLGIVRIALEGAAIGSFGFDPGPQFPERVSQIDPGLGKLRLLG